MCFIAGLAVGLFIVHIHYHQDLACLHIFYRSIQIASLLAEQKENDVDLCILHHQAP